MPPLLALLVSLLLSTWAIRRDVKKRPGLSRAIWIPTLWVAIIASRPLSTWLNIRGTRTDLSSSLEGSPIDSLFYLTLIILSLVVVTRRRLDWGALLVRSWPVALFYGYLLFSVLWANSSAVSFKRWFKESGNILILLVILTESNPQQAMRAIFARCAYLLFPLSIVFIRYYPELGRRYSIHSGQQETTGVTFQKNSLGATVLVCGIFIVWELLELLRNRPKNRPGRWNTDLKIRVVTLAIGFWLLHLCDSKTSLVCLMLAGGILMSTSLPFLRKRLGRLAILALAAVVVFGILDQLLDIKAEVVQGLGRDMTFTGRTDVWRELLSVGTDPIMGTGFCSFWDDARFQSRLPDWVAFSAHNGYLEVYIAGGLVGVSLLGVMLLATAVRIHRSLAGGGDYAVVRFAIFVVALVANFSESNFAEMSPVGFLFLLAAIGFAPRMAGVKAASTFQGREFSQMRAAH